MGTAVLIPVTPRRDEAGAVRSVDAWGEVNSEGLLQQIISLPYTLSHSIFVPYIDSEPHIRFTGFSWRSWICNVALRIDGGQNSGYLPRCRESSKSIHQGTWHSGQRITGK